MANHAAYVRPNFVRRLAATRRGRVLLTLLVLMVAGATAAVAVFFATAKVTGGGQTGSFTLKWDAMNSPTASGVTTARPTIEPGGASLALPSGLTLFPGDSYTFSAKVLSDGTSGYVNGLSFPGLPAGYSATLTKGCGAAVSSSVGATVEVKIALDPSASPSGATWTLGSTAGVQASPQSTGAAPTSCPAYVGGAAA